MRSFLLVGWGTRFTLLLQSGCLHVQPTG
jgi:hypothetical protein